jgi:azurin
MRRYLTFLALTATVLGAAACSTPAATDTSASAPASPGATTSPATRATPVHDGRSIELSANDTMKFSVTEILAMPGEKLSVTLVNDGTTPKFSMGHNWVLVASGVDIQQFLVAAAESVTTDYVPGGTQPGGILAATKLLGPTERDTVTFTAPVKPGRYEFLCSFPGHFQVGMRGVLIVG